MFFNSILTFFQNKLSPIYNKSFFLQKIDWLIGVNILFVILATALVTGIVNFIFFPYTQLLGASGVVFALILLSSFAGFEEGKIPFTFILVAVIYIGEQVYQGIFVQDNIANLTHIVGGGVGSALGFVMNKNKMSRY